MSTVYVEIKKGLVENIWSDEPSILDVIVVNHDVAERDHPSNLEVIARADAYSTQGIEFANEQLRKLSLACYESGQGYAVLLSNDEVST